MPTYDYRCERTGEMFELWQSFSDDALTECPQIHKGETDPCKASVKKVFSKVGISFKGDGFYKNDHGSSSRPASEGSSSDSSSKDSAKESTSKESTAKSSESKGPDSKGSDSKGAKSKSSDSSSSSSKSGSSSNTKAD